MCHGSLIDFGYATGNTNPEDLFKAGLAALIPVLIRYVNPKDSAFGRGNG